MKGKIDMSNEEDQCEEGESTEPLERTPQQTIAAINWAFQRMDEEWLQNELGTEAVDVIYDALNLLLEKCEKEVQG